VRSYFYHQQSNASLGVFGPQSIELHVDKPEEAPTGMCGQSQNDVTVPGGDNCAGPPAAIGPTGAAQDSPSEPGLDDLLGRGHQKKEPSIQIHDYMLSILPKS